MLGAGSESDCGILAYYNQIAWGYLQVSTSVQHYADVGTHKVSKLEVFRFWNFG
jgi:hypothetical protein